MVVKTLLACFLLVGAAMSVFAGLAYSELHNAATSETPPTANEMPMTKIVGPELFDPGNAGGRPSDLAQIAFNRIYAIGGGGIVLVILPILFVLMPRSRAETPLGE
ncbi:MAG: hypothetical protein AAFX06_28960 [Planctomycetota bacterium]